MRRSLMIAALSLALAAGAVPAQDAPGSAIEGVISQQIDAFRMDDFATAFTYASPGIQRMFGSSETFGRMVREGYPMVWKPRTLDFGELREVAGGLWQRVIVTDAEGRVHALDYNMVQGENGWKINAVHLVPAPDVGA